LIKNPNVTVEIGGHTNTIPPDVYCDELSSNRAKNVAYYFYKKGIVEERLSYKGYGKRQPITLDESLQGRQKNQRVEIKILSL
jgi:outer membrane protein OmpA-like peptidoglycan-associated protein